MTSRRKSVGSKVKDLFDNLILIFEPVHLPEDENNERIKRLSRQIVTCVERAKKDRRRAKEQRDAGEIFSRDFDEIFGLKEQPV